jgi:hypothetical protein
MRKWATDLTDSTDLHGLLLESIRANPSNPFDPWSIPQWLRDNALGRSRTLLRQTIQYSLRHFANHRVGRVEDIAQIVLDCLAK